MPPSAREIKARLDDAIDSEGNVLDMATVLELVTTLEKTHLSKEALETTRIGKVINLMRKKTENEALATRAKKLVKKWQKLVNNHFKQLKQGTSPQSNSPLPTTNGVSRKTLLQDRPRSCPDLPSKPAGLHKQLLKERCGSPSVALGLTSTKLLHDDKQSTLKRTTPPPVNGDQLTKSESSDATESFVKEALSRTDSTESKCNSDDSTTIKDDIVDINKLDDQRLLPNNGDHTAGVSKEIKTNNEASQLIIEPLIKEPHMVQPCLPKVEIPPEDLRLVRKPAGDLDTNEVEAEIDGINGCFDSNNVWCPWMDVVVAPNENLHVLPYINLE